MSNRAVTSGDMTNGFVYAGEATENLVAFRGVIQAAAGGASYCDSGFPTGVTVQAAAIGERVSAKASGFCYLVLNGNSVTIAHNDPIKLTTNGIGVKAASDHDNAFCYLEDTTSVDADGVTAKVRLGRSSISA